jgi:hypothetical protein
VKNGGERIKEVEVVTEVRVRKEKEGPVCGRGRAGRVNDEQVLNRYVLKHDCGVLGEVE